MARVLLFLDALAWLQLGITVFVVPLMVWGRRKAPDLGPLKGEAMALRFREHQIKAVRRGVVAGLWIGVAAGVFDA